MTVVAPAAASSPARLSVERVPWPTVQMTALAGERLWCQRPSRSWTDGDDLVAADVAETLVARIESHLGHG
jgi:hypothetical protein